MEWYFKQLLRDRRFKIAVKVAGASLLLAVIFLVIRRPWSFAIAAYVCFPVFALSLLSTFAVLGIIVRSDYLDRKG
jgi:hypothetical protein